MIKLYLNESMIFLINKLIKQNNIKKKNSSIKYYFFNSIYLIPISTKKNAFANSGLRNISIPISTKKICEGAFCICNHLSKVDIPTDSLLECIETLAFSHTLIKDFFIPSKLIVLEEKCFDDCQQINISISKDNKNFLYYNNQIILKKSNPNNDIYDVLLLAQKDVKKENILDDIRVIVNNAFDHCKLIEKVDISMNSNLEIIKDFAFYYSFINEITIPPKLTKICSKAFMNCYTVVSLL